MKTIRRLPRRRVPAPERPIVSFAVGPADAETIRKIVARGWRLPWLRTSYAGRVDMHMDVTAVHCNGTPLRLEALLASDDFNFAHDMSGICRHLDRDTGQLRDHFRPRFAQPEAGEP